MPAKNITSAIKVLTPLLKALETAYWDSSEIDLKDRIFDLVVCVHAELNELAKLSISDLDLPYETITPEFAGSCSKLRYLLTDVDQKFPRTKTALELKTALPEAAALLTACEI